MTNAFEEQLVTERARTEAQVAALERDLAAMIASSAQVSTDDEHDPEGATIAFERAQVAALLAQASGRLTDVNRALARITAGTYGICERCGKQIAAERLAARPFATTCVVCAAAIERSR
jgi:DnaK suppressor protein